jgi:hypothetical protein
LIVLHKDSNFKKRLLITDRWNFFFLSSADAALAQILEEKYAERYGKADKSLVLIGVNFESAARRVVQWKVEGYKSANKDEADC